MSLRSANSLAECSSRVKACAIRSPDTFSCMSAFTALTCSRASVYAAVDRRWKMTVATTTTGSTVSATSARPKSVTSSATVIVTTVRMLASALTRPVCRNVDSASTSVVILVMIRPAISRSK